MKKLALFLLSVGFCITLQAQEQTAETLEIQAVIDACISMRDAAAVGDTATIRHSAQTLRDNKVDEFNSLRLRSDSDASLNGHLVFSESFADSLIADSAAAYRSAQQMAHARTVRGQYTDGSVHAKTCFVKANGTAKYSFPSKGRQELAVVAEAGGRVTMRIHVTNRAGLDERHDDTQAVHQGLPHRRAVFNLPEDQRNTVELEVVNCCDKDISFVVISN